MHDTEAPPHPGPLPRSGGEGEDLPPELVAAYEARVKTRAAANATPLPGPLLDALLVAAPEFGGLKLRELVAFDWPILQKLDHPFIRIMAQGGLPKEARAEIEVTPEELLETAYLLSRPVMEAREALAGALRQGGKDNDWRAEFRKVALAATDGLLARFTDYPLLEMAVAGVFTRAASTSVETRAAEADPENFPSPPKAAVSTALAGGSITSGDSCATAASAAMK